MKLIIILSIAVWLLNGESTIRKNMEDKFCQAILQNERASLRAIIDMKLDTLNMKNDLEVNFDLIKQWMENYDCVLSVEIVPGVLRSDPPIKEFILTVKNGSDEPETRNIGIWIFPEKLSFNYK